MPCGLLQQGTLLLLLLAAMPHPIGHRPAPHLLTPHASLLSGPAGQQGMPLFPLVLARSIAIFIGAAIPIIRKQPNPLFGKK